MNESVRHMLIVLGDQLDPGSTLFEDADPNQDVIWMAEVGQEAKQVWNHKARIAVFLSGMRHFRQQMEKQGFRVYYHAMTAEHVPEAFETCLSQTIRKIAPELLRVVEPGEWRVRETLLNEAKTHTLPLDILPDSHFFCPLDAFRAHADGRKQLRMEYFYREMRKSHNILMEGASPVGGKWNFDASNRKSFSRKGPPERVTPYRPLPDAITKDVIELVQTHFADHPGTLESFAWPVTPEAAEACLDDFIAHRLPHFGAFQDAMWQGEAFLYHSLLSVALNLKLISPRHVVAQVERAYRSDPDQYPIEAVEGFIRQILGWREYVRGVYHTYMPEYLGRNALSADADLPDFYWTGNTDMTCLGDAIDMTLAHGYAHHIQRLMVTGLFALLYGVEPRQVHEWYLAVYVDAVEWVELPNTLGMSQYADGGVMASKPYIASGRYIQRMSNYCHECPYNPEARTGDTACPFTTLYWDFLMRHANTLRGNNRMNYQLKNLERIDSDERAAIRKRAAYVRQHIQRGCGEPA